MSGETVVNGGTGSYALEATVVALVFVAGPFLLVLLAEILGRVRARRAALAGPPRLTLVRSPDRCRACGYVGWHDQGCGLLDRLDAGARS